MFAVVQAASGDSVLQSIVAGIVGIERDELGARSVSRLPVSLSEPVDDPEPRPDSGVLRERDAVRLEPFAELPQLGDEKRCEVLPIMVGELELGCSDGGDGERFRITNVEQLELLPGQR